MVVNTNDILVWCGVNTVARRTAIIEDLMPATDGLENLSDESEEVLKDACKAYSNRRPNPITLT